MSSITDTKPFLNCCEDPQLANKQDWTCSPTACLPSEASPAASAASGGRWRPAADAHACVQRAFVIISVIEGEVIPSLERH